MGKQQLARVVPEAATAKHVYPCPLTQPTFLAVTQQ